MKKDQLKKKIALGTVQLGLPYGINNKTGKPDSREALNILRTARHHGIHLLDTADAYGDSIQVIGKCIREENDLKSFSIVSKFIYDTLPLTEKLNQSLQTLECDRLYSYMYHRFIDYREQRHKDELIRLKRENKIQHIGVSLYSEEELAEVIHDPEITVLQLPLNPFDNSHHKQQLVKEAKERGKEIHIRSVFFQGLFFQKPSELTGNLKELSGPLQTFQKILADFKVSPREACLNYALHHDTVDYAVLGVDTAEQLVQNLDSIATDFPPALASELEAIVVTNRALLNPANWKP